MVPNRMTLSLSCLNSRMVKTKVTPKKGKEECLQKVKTRAQVHVELAPPALVDPPGPVQEIASSQEELNKRIEEAEQLEQVGRSPEPSPT